MTTTKQISIGLAAVAVVVLLGALAIHRNSEQTAQTDDQILTTSPSDTSDQALDSDAAAIDTQLSGLATDTATIDDSIEAGSQ
jgi:hypothetical protein